VHTADDDPLPPLLPVLLDVTQQMSVAASHELLPHAMDALVVPDELPELDDELDDDLPPELDELLLLLDDLPPLDDELLDDFPPDDEPELDPPPELDDADVPFSGPSKSAVLVAPPHAATSAATAPMTMHPLQAMTAKPM
jgi:hypothetical protein